MCFGVKRDLCADHFHSFFQMTYEQWQSPYDWNCLLESVLKKFLNFEHTFYAPSPLKSNWLKPAIVLMYQILDLCTDIPCQILVMSFSSRMSQQWKVRIAEQLTRTFQPVLPKNLQGHIFSNLDSTIGISGCKTLFVSYRALVEDINGTPTRTFIAEDEKYPLNVSSISAWSLLLASFSTAHSNRKKMPPRLVRSVLVTTCTHCRSWAEQHKADKLLELALNLSAMRYSYQKIPVQIE